MKNTSGNKRADRERRLGKKSHEFKNPWRPRVTQKKSTKITVAWIHGREKPTQENRSKTNKKPLLLSFFFQRKRSFYAVEHTNASRAWQRVSRGRKQAGTCQYRDPTKDLCPTPAPRRPPRRTACAAARSHLHGFRRSPVSSAHPDPTSPSLISGGPTGVTEQLLTHVYTHTHVHIHTHTGMHAHTTRMRACAHTCTHAHTRVYTHAHTCMRAPTCTCMRTQTHAYTS